MDDINSSKHILLQTIKRNIILNTILIVIAYLFVQMCIIWVFYRLYKNPSIVDSSWSIGLMISGLIYLCSSAMTSRKIIVGILLIIWSLRLAGYLWLTRLRSGHIDKRYKMISNKWKMSQSLGFFLNFQLQALLIFIISFIFFFISLSPSKILSTTDFIAIAIVLIGILGESISDLQLHRFKQAYPGKVCNIGLWSYSRHPNYFFDWLTWFGFTLFAIQSTFGYFSFISLVLLYAIFTRITGPITERASIQSRGRAYVEYQERTSMFIPWFRR